VIHVDSGGVMVPAILAGEPATKELERARRFCQTDRPGRFGWRLYRHASVLDALEALFHGKCAHCESQYDHLQPVEVDH
jgi:hypothetical protein